MNFTLMDIIVATVNTVTIAFIVWITIMVLSGSQQGMFKKEKIFNYAIILLLLVLALFRG